MTLKAERKIGTVLLCAVFPALWLCDATLGQALGARPAGWPYAIDFHPVWHAAHAFLVGTNPYPAAAAVLHSADVHPTGPAGALFVYPLPVAALLAPLGALPYAAAAAIFTLVSIGAVLLALRLLNVRDWRCYGIAFATPAVMTAVSWGTMTPLLMLAVAVAWRYRTSNIVCGLAVAAAIVAKLFLWPLVLWLLLARRWRAAGVAIGAALLAVLAAWGRLGFRGLVGYPALMHDLALVQAPRGDGLSAVVGSGAALWAVTLLVLAGAALLLRGIRDERIVFSVAIVLAVSMSPIVWVHYFALVIPLLALWTPRFGISWLVPLGFWLTLSQQPGQPWRVALALAIFAGAVVVAAGSAVERRAPMRRLLREAP